jgi:hypothetical protein
VQNCMGAPPAYTLQQTLPPPYCSQSASELQGKKLELPSHRSASVQLCLQQITRPSGDWAQLPSLAHSAPSGSPVPAPPAALVVPPVGVEPPVADTPPVFVPPVFAAPPVTLNPPPVFVVPPLPSDSVDSSSPQLRMIALVAIIQPIATRENRIPVE